MRYNEIISYLTESLEDKININKNKFLNDNRFNKLKDKEEIFDIILNTDPTKNKSYLPWLISKGISEWTNKDDKLFKEDLPSTRETLQRYNELKQGNKLKPEHKDINRFKSEADLWKTLRDEYSDIDTSSKKEIKKNIEQEFFDKGEATLVHNDSKYKIVIPHSQKASCYFGINTKWCTAADKNNMFDRYNKDGNLYIILIKANNERYQFHIESGSYMDEMDRDINLIDFNNKYPEIFEILFPTDKDKINMVKLDPFLIQIMKDPSEEIQTISVMKNAFTINYIENPSEKMQFLSIKQDPHMLEHIKNPTEKVINSAIDMDGWVIEYIKNPTEIMQLEAISQDSNIITVIEKPAEKVQKYIIDNYPDDAKNIHDISPKMKKYAKSKGIDI